MVFDHCPVPTRSPWGPIQHAEQLAPGIWQAGTAGHGGIKLSRQRNAAMPDFMRIKGGWYEEDSLWARVAIVFRDEPCFQKEAKGTGRTHYDFAEETIRHWDPEVYEQFFSVQLTPETSRRRAEQAFKADTFDKFVVRSAWGSWSKFVPPGMVGVAAHRASDDMERWFLVQADEYGARTDFGFVIDPAQHREVEAPSAEMRGSR